MEFGSFVIFTLIKGLDIFEMKNAIGTIEICSDKAILNKRIQEAVYEHLLFIMVMMISVLSACYISMLIILHPLYSIRLAMARLSDKMEPITDPSLLKQNENFFQSPSR